MSVQTPPGPKGHFLLGNLPERQRDTMGTERQWVAQYGDTVKLTFAGRKAHLINHPDDIHQVLVTDAAKFYKAPVYRLLLSRFLGEGLLTSEGDFWRRQRRLSQPAFHRNRIQAYAEIMVNYTAKLLSTWHDQQVHDINRNMMRLTLNIVSRTLFNANVDQDADTVNHALTDLLHATDRAIQSPIQVIPNWIPTPDNRRSNRAMKALDAIINGIIEERRRTGADTGDLLSMLMLAEDEDGNRMSDKQVRDEAVTIFLAGHETTANALTWTWYLLAQHPEVERKLHSEIAQVLGDRLPTLEDLRALEYTAQVFKESMRLYPPIPAFGRLAMEDVQIGDYLAPKGTIILISPHLVHRDGRWYDNPDEFRPERFAKENEKALPKYAYLPFGGGPRICIGNSFAEMEAVLVLATVAQRYYLRLEPGQTVIPEPTLTLRPKDPIMMRLHTRQAVTDAADVVPQSARS